MPGHPRRVRELIWTHPFTERGQFALELIEADVLCSIDRRHQRWEGRPSSRDQPQIVRSLSLSATGVELAQLIIVEGDREGVSALLRERLSGTAASRFFGVGAVGIGREFRDHESRQVGTGGIYGHEPSDTISVRAKHILLGSCGSRPKIGRWRGDFICPTLPAYPAGDGARPHDHRAVE